MFLLQVGGFYVLIVWRFYLKLELVNSVVCEQGGYICGIWSCVWFYIKQIFWYRIVGNKVGLVKEVYGVVWKGRVIYEII